MNKHTRFGIASSVLCFIAGCFGTVPAMSVAVPERGLIEQRFTIGSDPRTAVGNRFVVILSEDIDVSTFIKGTLTKKLKMLSFVDAKISAVYTAINGFTIDIPNLDAKSVRKSLLQIPGVKHVEGDRLIQIEEKQLDPPWGLDRIDQLNAIFNHTYEYSLDGSGVNVYVLDTGILITHHDFAGMALVAYDTVDDDNNNDTSSTNDRNGLEDGLDCNGHGTHVSAIVGGTVYGVAKKSSLFSVRVIGRTSDGEIVGKGCGGYGRVSEIIAGIDWVTLNRPKDHPAVVNLSIGGDYDVCFNSAIERSIAAGIVYVVAAGNRNRDIGTNSPASAKGVIPVAASEVWNRLDYRWEWSNYGANVVFAPGVAIVSAGISNDSDVETKEGTSMAAPHVVGVVAQYLQIHSGASPAEVTHAIRINAIVGRIVNPGPGSDNLMIYSGFQ